MNRQEALSLLNDLLASFESMQQAPIISICQIGGGNPDWELQVKWLVGSNEKARLAVFAAKHGISMKEQRECTFFR